jgi:plasmid maintenance system antidote protein VapI
MRLQEYLETEGITIKKFASRVGVTAQTIKNIMNSTRDVKISTALKIQQLTHGIVSCEDMCDPEKLP